MGTTLADALSELARNENEFKSLCDFLNYTSQIPDNTSKIDNLNTIITLAVKYIAKKQPNDEAFDLPADKIETIVSSINQLNELAHQYRPGRNLSPKNAQNFLSQPALEHANYRILLRILTPIDQYFFFPTSTQYPWIERFNKMFKQVHDQEEDAFFYNFFLDEKVQQQFKKLIEPLRAEMRSETPLSTDMPQGLESFLPRIEEACQKLTNFLQMKKALIKIQEEQSREVEKVGKKNLERMAIEIYAKDYKDLAQKQTIPKRLWLTGAIFFLVLALAVLSYFICHGYSFFEIPYHVSVPQLLFYSLPRLFLVTLLVSSSFWCGRMYKILSHIQETYWRMQTGISNAEKIINSSHANDDLRRNLLLLATRAMFSISDSGYLMGKDTPPAEALKNIAEDIGSSVINPSNSK